MSSEQDEALYWAGKAMDNHHNILDTAQAAAGKWQAGICSLSWGVRDRGVRCRTHHLGSVAGNRGGERHHPCGDVSRRIHCDWSDLVGKPSVRTHSKTANRVGSHWIGTGLSVNRCDE
jgi:hypothetical protein